MLFFEGDWVHESDTQVSFIYYFIKNAVDNPIGLSGADETRFGENLSSDNMTSKLSLNTIVSLTTGDTLNVYLNPSLMGDTTDHIESRSLLILKLS